MRELTPGFYALLKRDLESYFYSGAVFSKVRLNIRRAVVTDAPAIATVHVDAWKTAYRGVVPEDYLANLSYSEREARWSATLSDPANLVFVAEDSFPKSPEKWMMGFCSGGANRSIKTDPDYAGELGAIYILEEYRGRGTGSALVRYLVRALVERGYTSMLVWVLARNPYRRFYEKLGGEYIRSQEIEIGGETFEEAAYGWRDLEILLSRLQ